MSDLQRARETMNACYRLASCGILLSLAAMAWVVGVMPAHGQDPASTAGAVLDLSGKLADAAARDVTRLALQVAIVSVLMNAGLVAVCFRVAFLWARKPCMLATEDARAVLRDVLREAAQK